MKIVIKSFLIVIILFGTYSCSKDFLGETPTDALIDDIISEDQLEGFRNAMYASIPVSEALSARASYTDNAYSRNAWDSHGVLIQTNGVSAGNGFGYNNEYEDIRTYNALIENLSTFELVADDIKKLYTAEARFFRAWKHLDLTLYYGKIAIVESLNPEEVEGEGVPRSSVAEVRAWILNELDLAINDLPAETAEDGYITKAQAYAIKARAAYYFGMYKEAAAAADWVITNGGFQLNKLSVLDAKQQKDADFFKTLVDFDAMGLDQDKFLKGIFSYESIWDIEGNSEVIIAKEYTGGVDEDFADWNRVLLKMSPNQTSLNCWNIWAPLQDLVDSYWAANGDAPVLDPMSTRATGFQELTQEVEDIKTSNSLSFNEAVGTIAADLPSKPFMKQFLNRDSRLYASIAFPFAAINRHQEDGYELYLPDVNNYGQTGYTFRKGTGVGDDFFDLWGGYTLLSSIDVPMLRLSEMLLTYAEAQTQDVGYDGTVVARLNLLRDRCGMPDVPTGLSKNEALDLIRRERRIELANEGLRFYDIRLYEDDERNGGYKGSEAASVVMQGVTSDPAGVPRATKTWDPRLMLLPLPSSAIDRNKALIGDQNPGY